MPAKDDGNVYNKGLHFVGNDKRNGIGSSKDSSHGISHNSVYAAVWKHVLIMAVDPHPEVQQNATIVVDYVHHSMLQSPLGPAAQSLMDEIKRRSSRLFTAAQPDPRPSTPVHQGTASVVTLTSQPGLLKRTASYLFPFVASADTSPAESLRNGPKSPASQRNSLPTRTRVPTDLNGSIEQNDIAATPGMYHAAKEPMSSTYKPRDLSVAPSLPLQSTFLEWSIEYFREPQMKPSEADEPGSTDYNERLWRRSRNESILRETQPQKEAAREGKWSSPAGFFNNTSQPSKMSFHQFEDHVAVSDDRDTICIWDWKKQDRLSRFSNGNPEGSKISDLKFINEDDQAYLLTGSSDGVIRIYRNYDTDKKIQVASAWRALTHIVPSNVYSGMVFDWQQVTGKLLVAGDVKVIRVWSAASETCIVDINARSGSCVTSLTSDQMTGNCFVAGFGDGAIRVFDVRNKPSEAMVRKWKDERDRVWIKNVHMQRGGQRELLSASRNGKVKLWDIRMDKPLRTFLTTNDTLRTASVHEHLPVFAV
jgi:regulator-associated protein of mTOR